VIGSTARWLAITVCLVLGCAMPGRLYPVAPAISGRLQGADHGIDNARLVLRIIQRESAVLHATEERPLPGDGRFSFEAIELEVAGHEYSKVYRIFLSIRGDDRDRVVWRAELSRLQLAGPIRLDCDLSRPPTQGQPCWVRDPLQQPWLVADGRRTYQRLCVDCHGSVGQGRNPGTLGPEDLPPDLRTIARRRGGHFERAEITEWIEGRSAPEQHGSRVMPVWGERLSVDYERYAEGDQLIGATLDPLVVYLESLQDSD
jgi:hypothetical protein